MFKKMHWMIGALIFFFSFSLYAMTCSNDGDCNKWAGSTCACGVSARCNGITAQNKTGACQCFGAEGHCANTDDAAAADVYVAPGVSDRRDAVQRGAVRRGAVRSGNVDVDVSR